MSSPVVRSRTGWQRVAACVLVFALIIQGLAFTLARDAVAGDPSTAANPAGFELCSHDGTSPGAAPGHPAADNHCIFCLAAASYALNTATATLDFHVIAIVIVPWRLVALKLPITTVDASARPRGPPSAA
jgi:hypothetical protein